MGAATPQQIADYWSTREDGLALEWAEARERCWRCGYRTKLELCQIVPRVPDGDETADNLVLLCSRCHREAPNHSNPRYMWVWLRATCVPRYDMYWVSRGWDEFEVMFGRAPFGWATGAGLQLLQEWTAMLRAELRRAVGQFGEGHLNPSTIACMMAEIEQQLADQHGVVIIESGPGGTPRRFLDKMLGPAGPAEN
jgi:HNH endonuclease